MKIKWIVGGLLWASSYLQAAAQEYKLWYDEPAQVWTEALPLGIAELVNKRSAFFNHSTFCK